jgi:hypothetical protein
MVFRVVVIMEEGGGEVVYHCQNMSQLQREAGSHRRCYVRSKFTSATAVFVHYSISLVRFHIRCDI